VACSQWGKESESFIIAALRKTPTTHHPRRKHMSSEKSEMGWRRKLKKNTNTRESRRKTWG
jgi:hypothetical protein